MLASARSGIVVLLVLILLLYTLSFQHAPFEGLEIFSKPVTNDSDTVLDGLEALIDENHAEAPRLRQASMVFGGRESALYERSLKTHFRHGNRWGYPTHVLRQDTIGNGDFSKVVFNKILYLQTLVVKESIKPPEKRSEWIV